MLGYLEVRGTHLLVMRGRVAFGEVVGIVVLAAFPVDSELTLSDSVADPIEPHVHGFGAFGFDRVVGNSGCYLVIGDYICGAFLGVAHFFEHCSYHGAFLAIVEQSCCFWFCG